MTGRRGIALLIVVAVLGALAMTAGMAALSARLSTSQAFAGLQQLELSAAIDSAVARSAFELSQADADWIADGRLYEWQIDDITVRVRPLAEAGRFDLNRGEVSVLAALLEAHNVPPLTAGRIAGAVADWRDADNDVGNAGAEATAYRAEGLAPPPNRPFLAVAEFRSVLGVDEAIYETMAPFLTLNGAETVTASLAPPELLEAAGLTAGEARRILAARRGNRRPPVLEDSSQDSAAQLGIIALFIEAEAPNRARRTREIIISLPGEESLYDTLSRHSHVVGYADFLDPERGN